jgi:hypothetical protein
MKTKARKFGLQIVVLDRGFVYVGNVTADEQFATIENAKCVRVWGTQKGVGQLALDGPQRETALDAAGTVTAPMRAVIHFIECATDAWKGK